MQRLSIPQHLIELHVQIKTTITCQFGPLTCMRLTGEPGTYDDNTDYNLAVLYMEYAVRTEGVFVSGDHSLLSSEPATRDSWGKMERKLHLSFKKEKGFYGLFCGYYLGHAGAVRSPLALTAKLSVAYADGSIDDKIASYASEFAVGHSLGDSLWQVIPEDHVLYQSAVFDFFCRKASRELKVLFKIGEVPEEHCRQMLEQGFRWLSRPLYALLDRTSRMRLLGRDIPVAEDSGSNVKGVLLHYCNLSQ